MKPLLALCLAALFSVSALSAERTLTKDERAFLLTHLEQTRTEFLNSIKGVTAEQWKFKPSSGGWSIGECAEHITVTEDVILGLVTNRMLRSPVDPGVVISGKEKDAEIIAALTDRSKKSQAPEVLKPTGKFPTLDSVVSGFGGRRDRSVEFVRATQEDLRGHVQPHPAYKTIDAYQYLLLMSAHTTRITAQLREVKLDAQFPK